MRGANRTWRCGHVPSSALTEGASVCRFLPLTAMAPDGSGGRAPSAKICRERRHVSGGGCRPDPQRSRGRLQPEGGRTQPPACCLLHTEAKNGRSSAGRGPAVWSCSPGRRCGHRPQSCECRMVTPSLSSQTRKQAADTANHPSPHWM